ncbi:MAG: hypothetical protein EPN33_06165 [Acidobacteria bacterium]|nr:MAG: hypothetical protein EPN33_06165 [Acidobacteriota bacterium]
MKARITVTVNAALLARARAASRRRGQSLSQALAPALRELAEEREPSFAERWRGKFRPGRRRSARYRRLAQKYL